MNRLQINTMNAFIRRLDIGLNEAPEAIFDPLIQGFNVWCTPDDNPGDDWEKVKKHMIAGAYTKPSEYVGCAFYCQGDDDNGYIAVSSDAYALRDHLQGYQATYKNHKRIDPVHNRPEDIAWVKAKVEWVFQQIGIPCPEIRVEDD